MGLACVNEGAYTGAGEWTKWLGGVGLAPDLGALEVHKVPRPWNHYQVRSDAR